MLIHAGWIALAALLATLVSLAKRQGENAFTRAFVTVFYFVLAVADVPIEMARELNRWFWLLLLSVEVIFWSVTTWLRWWRST
jgi:hypothetical protein